MKLKGIVSRVTMATTSLYTVFETNDSCTMDGMSHVRGKNIYKVRECFSLLRSHY